MQETRIRKIRRFIHRPFYDKLNSLTSLFYLVKGALFYRRVFAEFGTRSILRAPLLLANPGMIRVGANVRIREGVRMEALCLDPVRRPEFVIEDNVNIEQHVQLVCHCRVVIKNGAGLGPRCIIMDTSHPFFDAKNTLPISQRLSTAPSFVEIGEGALLGAGTFVMPNVRVGRGSVIGPNSVVRRSIPDFCVAAGNPAVVLLQYDLVEDRWIRPKIDS